MATTYDAIVIGAGASGLTAAAVLAKAGRRVLALERESVVGGKSRLIEVAPGFRAPISVDSDGVPSSVSRALALDLATVVPATPLSVALDGGGFLSLPSEVMRAAQAIGAHSPRDAKRWPEFTKTVHALAGFLDALYQLPAPDIDTTAVRELPGLLGLGRSFRALGRRNMSEILRVLPLPVQDFMDEWFESPALKAAVGAGAVRDLRQGPRSGGTTFALLHYLTGGASGAIRGRAWLRTSPDALVTALEAASRSRGATIRTGADVARITVRDDAVTGVVLANGEEISAGMVLSTADPARTLLGMIDPVWLDPEVLLAVRNIRFRGCTTIVQYALDRLPDAPGLANAAESLAGVVTLSGDLDRIEKAYDAAKHGGVSEAPHVEITMPSLRWPQLAPAGKHVLVAKAQYAAYQRRDGKSWDDAARARLGEGVTREIARVMPRFSESVLHRTVLTPADLEKRFALTEGAVSGGELMLDQILFMRPVAGWGRYAMPVDGLYLGGAGTHPGPGQPGAPGLLAAQRMLADRGR